MDTCPGHPEIRCEELVIVISNVEGLGHSLWCLFVRIMMGLYIIKAFKLFFWMLKKQLRFGL